MSFQSDFEGRPEKSTGCHFDVFLTALFRSGPPRDNWFQKQNRSVDILKKSHLLEFPVSASRLQFVVHASALFMR